jgi:hypothetical protein
MARLRTIAARSLLAVVGILLVTVVLGGYLDVQLTKSTFDKQYKDRARAVANVVAQVPAIASAVAAGDPQRIIAPLASRMANASGASYVVVTDRTGLRFSHPNPKLIGRRLEEPVAVLDGQDHVGIDNGSLGRSANGNDIRRCRARHRAGVGGNRRKPSRRRRAAAGDRARYLLGDRARRWCAGRVVHGPRLEAFHVRP